MNNSQRSLSMAGKLLSWAHDCSNRIQVGGFRATLSWSTERQRDKSPRAWGTGDHDGKVLIPRERGARFHQLQPVTKLCYWSWVWAWHGGCPATGCHKLSFTPMHSRLVLGTEDMGSKCWKFYIAKVKQKTKSKLGSPFRTMYHHREVDTCPHVNPISHTALAPSSRMALAVPTRVGGSGSSGLWEMAVLNEK